MSESDVTEMRYVTDKWTKLLHSISMYKMGHTFLKENISISRRSILDQPKSRGKLLFEIMRKI